MMCREIDGRTCQFNGYGIAFTKTFARRNGINPVWYLDITPRSPYEAWLTEPARELIAVAQAAATPQGALRPDPAQLAAKPILRLLPLIGLEIFEGLSS